MNCRPSDPASALRPADPSRAAFRARRRARRLPATAGVLLASLLLCTAAAAQSRGELLYATHCIECHSTRMHWRDKKLATDWSTLREQVRRWQAVASLDWRDEDILDVTRHLNERYYHFPAAPPADGAPAARVLAENGR